MRTPLLVTVLGFSLAGCLTIGDSGSASTAGGGGGDDDTGSNSTGSGGSGSNQGSNNSTPGVNAAVDRMTVPTELGKSEVVTLTLTSVGSFAGDVTIAPSLVDGTGAALTTGGLTVTGPASITLAANGTSNAMYTIKVPTNATATQLSANLKLDVTSPAGSKSFTSALTIAPTLTITYAAGLGSNVTMHPIAKQAIALKRGAKIVLHNADTVAHRTHAPGTLHEPSGGGQPGGTYVIDTADATQFPGGAQDVGCHTHDTQTYAKVTVE